jgi:hypothetical protein
MTSLDLTPEQRPPDPLETAAARTLRRLPWTALLGWIAAAWLLSAQLYHRAVTVEDSTKGQAETVARVERALLQQAEQIQQLKTEVRVLTEIVLRVEQREQRQRERQP